MQTDLINGLSAIITDWNKIQIPTCTHKNWEIRRVIGNYMTKISNSNTIQSNVNSRL